MDRVFRTQALKEGYEPTMEEFSKAVYTKKYKSFDEFCSVFHTFDDLVIWFHANRIKWPKYDTYSREDPLNYTGSVTWPDELLKTKTGVCFDHALFAYMFCKRNGIPAKIYRFSRFYNLAKTKMETTLYCSSHFVTLVKRKFGYWMFSYSGTGSDTAGPFDTEKSFVKWFSKRFAETFEMMTGVNDKIKYHMNVLPESITDNKFPTKFPDYNDRYTIRHGAFTDKDMDFILSNIGNKRITINEFVEKSDGCHFDEDKKVIKHSLLDVIRNNFRALVGKSANKIYRFFTDNRKSVKEDLNYKVGDDLDNEKMVNEGFFDRFKKKYSDEELLKMNNEMVRMNKKDGNAYWNTHGVPIQDKLYNMSPEETSPEIRKAIAIKACSVFKSCLSKIKDPNFRKAVTFRKPSNAEMNEWVETGEGLWFGNWNLWTFTPKARTDTDSNIYFWNIMQGFLNECNIRLGNRSFKIESDGDWDDGAIGLVDRTVTTESYEQTMEKTVTYGEELAPKNMNHFKIREDRKDMTRGYMDPEVIYNPPKNFKNLDQISGLELQTFKGFRKLDDDIKMIFHSGSDYNCIGYIRCPETGIQLTKRWMPEASGRIERYDYYIKDSKGHGGKFELWFNPDRHYASEAALVLEASAHGEEISMQDVKRKIRFVEGDKGTMNSVYVMNGKQYRVRVETLVVRNLHGEPHIFFQKKDKPSSYGQMYKLPGGSVEPNKDWATQASAECNEEILTKIKNIRYTGVSYIKEYPPGKTPSWQRASVLYQKGVDYTGAITFVFVAEYDGPYKKYVHAIDRDSLAKEGKWYPVKDFNHLCNDEHKGIIYGVKLVSDEPSADAMTEGFQPIEEVSVVKKIVGKVFGKDKQATKERQMSAERLKRRKDVVNHTFDFVGKFLAKTLKNPEFARCFTKDESMLRKWEQGGGKYTTVLYWDKKRFKGSDEEWNKYYKAFRREVSMHRTDVKGFSIGCARGSNSSNGLIQLTDHSKLWRPLNEVFATKEDYSLMGSLPKKKVHRKVVSRHAMNGKNKVKIVSQEQYPDWF